VTRVMGNLERLSREMTGGLDIKIMYDSETSWPLEWYLRRFPNRQFYSTGPKSPPPSDVPIVIVGLGNDSEARAFLNDYVRQQYVLRWWFPEEMYRTFIPEHELDYQDKGPLFVLYDQVRTAAVSLAEMRQPEEQARLWRFVMHREPYMTLGSTDFVLYVRREVYDWYVNLDIGE